jgi:hypothetical protein
VIDPPVAANRPAGFPGGAFYPADMVLRQKEGTYMYHNIKKCLLTVTLLYLLLPATARAQTQAELEGFL